MKKQKIYEKHIAGYFTCVGGQPVPVSKEAEVDKLELSFCDHGKPYVHMERKVKTGAPDRQVFMEAFKNHRYAKKLPFTHVLGWADDLYDELFTYQVNCTVWVEEGEA